jgi:hypothetical protein
MELNMTESTATVAWLDAADHLAPEGVIVETMISDERGTRNVANLKRIGRLWFLPDGSMYVYYAPTHWRTAAEGGE